MVYTAEVEHMCPLAKEDNISTMYHDEEVGRRAT